MNRNDVKLKLSNAFPSSIEIPPEDCRELRTKLVTLLEGDLSKMIAPVLIDAMETDCSNGHCPDWIDSIVRFLCADLLPEAEVHPTLNLNAEQFNQGLDHVRREAATQFDWVNLRQAEAIYDWLLLAKTWTESSIPATELDAAILFWSKRRKLTA